MNGESKKRWAGLQCRIGLTGGIATGKSMVGRLLAEHSLPVLDADVYAREALAAGTDGAKAVLQRYGDCVRVKGNKPGSTVIDRDALGAIIFKQPAEKAWLEAIVHPLVRTCFERELNELKEQPTVVLMIPLLFEAGLESLCSEVWLVDCTEEQQLQRLMARNSLGEAEALARIHAQWPLARKRPLADELINNTGSLAELAESVQRALAVSR